MNREIPVACKLSEPSQSKREAELARVFEDSLGHSELEDGYEFEFPGGRENIEKLIELVLFERECCPFLAFEFSFSPNSGPVALRVRGPEGSKELTVVCC
ncbi:MAG: hypothetical protein H0U65_07795 [Rubrobacter sp.]|nr:hypothetical protein [Rubrobacter sp.]